MNCALCHGSDYRTNTNQCLFKPAQSKDKDPVGSKPLAYNHSSAMNVETANPFRKSSSKSNKRQKTEHYTAEVVIEIENEEGDKVPIRGLLDTGTSKSILLKEFVAKGTMGKYKQPTVTNWETLGGNFQTKRKARVQFKFPELDTHKKCTWNVHVDETHKAGSMAYDIILGMDFMTTVGMYVDTAEKVVVWEERSNTLENKR